VKRNQHEKEPLNSYKIKRSLAKNNNLKSIQKPGFSKILPGCVCIKILTFIAG
jgi:hypothetical protein